MPMTPPSAKRPPDHAAANESLVPAMLRVSREGVLIGIEDHLGNDLGLPLTVRTASAWGVGKQTVGGVSIYPRRRILQAIDEALESGQSAILCVQSDSTGNDTDEWVYQTALVLAASHPDAHVIYRLWDDTNQRYNAAEVMQAGPLGQRHAYFPANARTFNLPLTAFTAITGDIDIRAKVSLDNYQRGAAQTLVARYGTAGNRAFMFGLNSSNYLQFTWTTDGTANITVTSSAALTNAAAEEVWLRATLDVDNGNTGRTCTLYTSADGVTWTQVGQSATSSGGATSIYDAAAQEYEIGGRGSAGDIILGKIYEVQIRNGIDGHIQNPQPIESWSPRGPSGSYVAGTFGGSPTLHVINGAKPGADATYLTDATRFPKMVPPIAGGVIIQSCGHNDGVNVGLAYQTIRDNWLAQVKDRCPSSLIAIITQNPQIAPSDANVIANHVRRYSEMLAWAMRNNVPVANTYAEYLRDPRGLSVLIKIDGIHPTADGSLITRDCVLAS